MKIGLVGEAPNDTNAIQNLLRKQYASLDYEFFPLINNIHGSELDNQKTKRSLQREYETEKPDVVIFIRDLDGTIKNNTAMEARRNYFRSSNSIVNKKGILLLNIFEIEALIIADIEAFNRHFNCQLKYEGDLMEVEQPKEDLKMKCNRFNESANPELFTLLSFETVRRNCSYFHQFIVKFEKKVNQHTG